jgi:hypothetical protein
MGAASRETSILRIAGSVVRTSGWLRLRFIFAESQVLEKREGDHREHGVMV